MKYLTDCCLVQHEILSRFITQVHNTLNLSQFISSSWGTTITLFATVLHFRVWEMSAVHSLLTDLVVWELSELCSCVVLAKLLRSVPDDSLEQLEAATGLCTVLGGDTLGSAGGCMALFILFRYSVTALKNCTAAADTCSSSCSCRCWFRSICLSFSINCLR